EELLGQALEGRRERLVLGTKGCSPVGEGVNDRGASRYHLMNALEASLRRLRTDHVDLYQVHQYDPTTPLDELMRTLDDMVRSGKVRYAGASNFLSWQICRGNDLAAQRGGEPFITTQGHYNLLERDVERELIPFCRASGVGLLAYFALANGLLAGRYAPDAPPPPDSRAAVFERTQRYLNRYATTGNYAVIARLTEWAQARGHTMPELAIAWVLAEPAVSTALTGASSVAQVVANARAADWALTPDEAEALRALAAGQPG
ncbi:MAG: aldo/keto reductase, partial [Chloroflexota bacterium]